MGRKIPGTFERTRVEANQNMNFDVTIKDKNIASSHPLLGDRKIPIDNTTHLSTSLQYCSTILPLYGVAVKELYSKFLYRGNPMN